MSAHEASGPNGPAQGGAAAGAPSEEDRSEIDQRAAYEAELSRIAWHLGNRHLPTQFAAGRLRIRADHVIAGMVEHLGGHWRRIEAPFDPEGGAYASAGHGHHHHHDHGDDPG